MRFFSERIFNFFMILLILSLLALLVGPLLSYFLDEKPRFMLWIDRVTFLIIAAVLLAHIIPESFEVVGWGAILVMLVGFSLPLIMEYSLKRAAEKVHIATLILGIFGIVAHGLLDGLSFTDHAAVVSHGTLPALVLLHRIPAGQLVWSLLRPSFGVKTAILTLVFLGLATIAGFVIGEKIQFLLHGVVFSWFQALVAGALLHVVIFNQHIHPHSHDHDH